MKPIMRDGICVGVEGMFTVEPSALIASGPDLRLLRLQPGMYIVIFDAEERRRYGVARVANKPQASDRIPVEMRFDKDAPLRALGRLYAMRIYIPTQFMKADAYRQAYAESPR